MINKGYIFANETIILQRDLTELDIFVKEFLDVLKKHSPYLIVSGYVSITSGRTRGTEDVDVLVPQMDEIKFKQLFDDLMKNNFWCYQGDNGKEIHDDYVSSLVNIRFAKEKVLFPNMEVIFVNEAKKIQFYELNNPQKIRIQDFEFLIPPIEFEILYKELILSGRKDMEDAKHLRLFYSDILKKENFEKYRQIIQEQ